jgi:hypothetical protein
VLPNNSERLSLVLRLSLLITPPLDCAASSPPRPRALARGL